MKRPLFTLASAVSLVLCVATVVLWVISMFWGVDVDWRTASVTLAYGAGCSRGEMYVSRVASEDAVPGVTGGFRLYFTAPTSHIASLRPLQGPFGRFHFNVIGFAAWTTTMPGTRLDALYWPCWVVVLVTALLPLRWFIRRGKAAAGHCRRCGYDLTANLSGTCPECGTPIKLASTPATAALRPHADSQSNTS